LSHSFWKSRFDGDPSIIGKQIRLNRENWTVVGVLPEGFQHIGGSYRSPLQGDTVAVWRPLGLDLNDNAQRAWHFTNAVARLRPGVSSVAASEDLNRILDDLRSRYPDNYREARARLEPLASEIVGRSSATVTIIASAALMVLLLACVNIAGLSVARVLARRRELAIRQALGGSGWRLIRTVLTENLILGLLAGSIGLLAAVALIPVMHRILPADFPRLHEVVFRWPTALLALLAGVLTSLAAGCVPALQQLRSDPGAALQEDSRSSAGGFGVKRLRAGLVATEVALSSILCFGAVLLIRSEALLGARDHGFDAPSVLTFEIALPSTSYSKPEQAIAFARDAAERWRHLPGVTAAGLSTNLPWTGYDENSGVDIPDRTEPPTELQSRYQGADEGFFRAMGFRLVRGRFVEASDQANSARVVVVNEAFAARAFPGMDPVGRHLKIWDQDVRIAGVVGDIRDHPADPAAEPGFWWPLAQSPFPTLRAAVRTSGDPLTLVSAVRAEVAAIDPELPIAEVRTMEDITGAALAERNLALWLCELFGALAVTLAATGVYGLLTFLIAQRRREIGVRLALGASRPSLLWMVVRDGLVLAAWGSLAGWVLAPFAARALGSLLYGVGATDLQTWVAAPSIIALATLLGSLGPGLAACGVEPLSALREQ
jgi:predicted permease